MYNLFKNLVNDGLGFLCCFYWLKNLLIFIVNYLLVRYLWFLNIFFFYRVKIIIFLLVCIFNIVGLFLFILNMVNIEIKN